MSEEIRLGVPAGDEAVGLQVEELSVVHAVSPKVDAERVSDGVEITVEDYREQPQTVKLNDGETPEKGVDYWTEADKAEIVAQAVEQTESDVADLKSHVESLDEHVKDISPRAKVTKDGTVATLVVTDTDGTTQVEIRDGETGPQGPAGQDGQPGAPGPAGPAGQDYVLTSADKAEIAQLVLAELPDAEVTSW